MAHTEVPKPGRDVGLDMAKAAAILLVVFWHAQIIVPKDAALVHAAFSYFYYIVTLSAVPLFFTVSLYLFLSKIGTHGFSYFKKRMLRLGEVYVFWMLAQTALSLACGLEWRQLSFYYLIRGGPGLPIVSGSVFYFLFNLLLLTALAYGLSVLPRRAREPVAWTGLAAGLAYLVASPWTGKLLPNYLASFLGYVPLAYLMNARPGLFRRHWLFTGLWLGFGAAEMALSKFAGIMAASPYARVSTCFGVLAIIALGAAFPLDRPLVRWLAAHSLGIFALHKYFQGLGFLMLRALGYEYTISEIALVPSILILAETLVLTLLAVAVLRRTPLVRYIT